MPHWSYIRAQARLRRREVRAHAANLAPKAVSDVLPAAKLLARAESLTGLVRIPLASGDPLLYGARATLDEGFIYYDANVEPTLALYYQAHEFAHHWLHRGVSLCSAEDVDFTESEDKSLYGEGRVEAYGPRQRRETEANVFAREFLLPGDVLRRLFVEEKLNAAQIAALLGLRLDFVLHALAHALLAPDIEGPDTPQPEEESAATEASATEPLDLTLDESQSAAAHSALTPLLVAAGPGTGKTRTLVGRVRHLLAEGVAPERIVALTFSNKAGEEMRERVARFAPDDAPKIWIGTFHAFGLELLRRYWQQAALPPRARVLDPVDALFILERHLPQLNLDHYQNLYEPTTHLAAILAAVSRAKDELVSPDEYAELAAAMLNRARDKGDAEETRRAERALEVARVYRFYQKYLEREGLLDFGELIFRTVRLLRERKAVRAEIRAQYRHVLVDEYQDVNRACGALLKLLTTDGEGLWVVGDTRQAIYRWRGAAPAQVRHFLRDFPRGRVQALAVNYRSLPQIVRFVSAVASQIGAATAETQTNTTTEARTQDKRTQCDATTEDADFSAWRAHRQEDNSAPDAKGAVRFEIATSLESEAREVARLIKERAGRGVPLSEQAVICRTHAQLARFARVLETEGVPTLYLGDIFERSEVRDLLALVALACDGSGRTLPRVARFPEYNVPLREVRAILQAAKATGLEFPAAIFSFQPPQTLDESTRCKAEGAETGMIDAAGTRVEASNEERGTGDGRARLNAHLARIAHVESAWKLLAHYLFVHSCYLAPLLADTSSAGAQKRLAVYQLLQFLHTEGARAIEATNEPDERRAALRYVRRLKSLYEDKSLRPAPASAEVLDAVRLTTVHGAKGLEWSCVYLPFLGRGHFPAKRHHEQCPPPAGMIEIISDDGSANGATAAEDKAQTDSHMEEEECLFFVALSRARDRLCLSRAERYGKSNSKASEFLERVEAHLPRPANSAATWHAESESDAGDALKGSAPRTLDPKPLFTERQLAVYLKCPRKFFYEQRLQLGGRGEETAYLRFHACVYETLRWLAAERAAGRLTEDEADAFQASAQEQLAQAWREKGPVGHVYEALYREQAELMLARAVRHYARASGRLFHRTWTVERPAALVNLTPDYVELIEDEDGATILFRQTRTGKPPLKTPDEDIYALFHAVATEHFPQARPRVELLYLSTDEVIEVNLSRRTIATRLKHYDDAIAGILAGEFPPEVNEHQCPRCAHFFTCPKAED